jgi:hypothetical protein
MTLLRLPIRLAAAIAGWYIDRANRRLLALDADDFPTFDLEDHP